MSKNCPGCAMRAQEIGYGNYNIGFATNKNKINYNKISGKSKGKYTTFYSKKTTPLVEQLNVLDLTPKIEPQETPVQASPIYYSQDVNTTINPLLLQFDDLSTDQDKFNFLTQLGGSKGWKYAANQLGLNSAQMTNMQNIANKSIGTKTFNYSANPQLGLKINSNVTNYYDLNMQSVDKSAIPQGSLINQLPSINRVYNASQSLAQAYETGGNINYFKIFR